MKKPLKITLIVAGVVLLLLAIYVVLNLIPGDDSNLPMMGTGCADGKICF